MILYQRDARATGIHIIHTIPFPICASPQYQHSRPVSCRLDKSSCEGRMRTV